MKQSCQNSEFACSLSDEDLANRRRMMHETLTPHLVSVDTLDNALRLVFPHTRDLQDQLETLVGLERECCDFLAFDLSTGHEHITLTIEGPAEARKTLMMFASLADHQP